MRAVPGLVQGAVAGAAGTTALNAVGYLDMVIRARPTSRTPEVTVETLAERLHLQVPGRADEQENRKAGLGPLVGLAAGIATGAALGLAAAIGSRPGRAVGTGLAVVAVMLAGNAPMTLLGITDPRTWSRADWAADLIPHLAYGVVTAYVLDGLQHPEGSIAR